MVKVANWYYLAPQIHFIAIFRWCVFLCLNVYVSDWTRN